jgi:hypothetical protein
MLSCNAITRIWKMSLGWRVAVEALLAKKERRPKKGAPVQLHVVSINLNYTYPNI